MINGPVNCVRLEGKINNVKKVVYVYFDWHLPHNMQKRCEDIRAMDIKQYFAQEFDKLTNSDKYIDFFLEMFPSHIHDKSNFKEIYLDEVRDLFNKSFNYDPSKNIVGVSKEFPNIRLHYFDIRDYIFIDLFDTYRAIKDHFMDSIYHNKNLSSYSFERLTDGLKILGGKLALVYKMIYKGEKLPKTHKNMIPQNLDDMAKYTSNDKIALGINYFKKSINRYENTENKKKINSYLNNEIPGFFGAIFEIINYLIDAIEKYKKSTENVNYYSLRCIDNDTVRGHYFEDAIPFVANVHINIIKLGNLIVNLFAFLTDIVYFRRLLDKEYITNSIVYTGAKHGAHHIYFLIKYYDFKITHYDKGKFDKKFIDDIKKSKLIYETDILCRFESKNITQCTDMSKFPENFQ